MDNLVQVLLSFEDGLEKEAGLGTLLQKARSGLGTAGAGAGLGMAAGAGAGALIGGARDYSAARDQGATRGQAVRGAVGGALSSAMRGSLIGAGAGGVAAGLGGARAAGLMQRVSSSSGAAGSLARFGQRQLHGVTGYATPQQLRAAGGGAVDAQQRLIRARQGGSAKELVQSMNGLASAEKSDAMGLTSIPGFIRGVAGKAVYQGRKVSPLEALKTGVGEQWHGAGLPGKALMLGLPAASVAGAVTGPSRTEEGGRLERVARGVASGLSFASPIGLVGQGLLGSGMGSAAGLVGRGGDKLVEKLSAPKRLNTGLLPDAKTGPESNESNSAIRPEMIYTNAAQGKAPEGMGL